MKCSSVTIQKKAIEQYFPVVMFILLYKVALTFESVDEILQCDHANERQFGRAMVPMARPNEPDMSPKCTKMVRLGIYRTQISLPESPLSDKIFLA